MIGNAITLLVIACVTILCGLGFLRAIGMSGFQYRILFAPTVALSVTSIALAIIVGLGCPVGKASVGIWVFWIAFVVLGLLEVRHAWSDLAQPYTLIIALLATMIVLVGYVQYGFFDYLGSPALDGWSYVSFGEYLRQYPKGTEGGLAPLYQYASHLSGTRYVASAMLAALIPPWGPGVDTQMTVGPLFVVSIISYATAVAYAATIVKQRGLELAVWMAVIIAMVGGWLPVALNANNYDNMLALPIAPTLFALALDRNLRLYGSVVLPALLIAASVYIYPELSPLIVAAYVIVAMEEVVLVQFTHSAGDTSFPAVFLKYGAVVVLATLIASPYLHQAIGFFENQLSTTTQMAGRPGEGIMPSLLDEAKALGAAWGLGTSGLSLVLGVLLSQVLALGAIKAYVTRNFSIICYLGIVGALFLTMAVVKHYDYGAYKILLVGWWAIAIVMVVGLQSLWDFSANGSCVQKWLLRTVVTSAFALSAVIWLSQPYQWIKAYIYKTATITREVKDAIQQTSGAIQVSISDTYLNAWLVYQLRDTDATFTEFHGYMDQTHVRPLMARSSGPDVRKINYILTDVSKFTTGDVIWKNALFKLVKGEPERQPPKVDINAPNGAEVLDGKPFFWVGREPASIVLTSDRKRAVRIKFETVPGPSVSAEPKGLQKGRAEILEKRLMDFDMHERKLYALNVDLLPGKNFLVFSHNYLGGDIPNANGDPRILLVGIKLLDIENGN